METLMVYSTFRDDRTTEQNIKQHSIELKMLKLGGHKFKVVDGVYRGSTEYSIVKEYSLADELYALDFLEQYSVLVLTPHTKGLYKAVLHFAAKKEDLGFFRQVPKEIALQHDSYTMDGDNYYVCTESDTVIIDELVELKLHN